MKKHIEEMSESRAMMETLTIKIRGEIQTAEYVILFTLKLIFLLFYRSELVDVKYNLSLVEAGEQEIVRVLQQCLKRQANTNTLNKQLFQERSNYQSDKKVDLKKKFLKIRYSL